MMILAVLLASVMMTAPAAQASGVTMDCHSMAGEPAPDHYPDKNPPEQTQGLHQCPGCAFLVPLTLPNRINARSLVPTPSNGLAAMASRISPPIPPPPRP